ncbi:MAG: O-antigen ligase family protein [Bacteroidales bacterium]|nr:O-antigen ligase family protein [Bacteroidales bacterium]
MINKNPGLIKFAIYLITSFAALLIVIAAFQFLKIYLEDNAFSHEKLYAITAVFAHKNLFMQYLFLCLPFSLYCFIISKNIWKYIGGVTSFLSIITIVVLNTRSVWIALFLGICSTMCILFLFYRKFQIRIKRMLFSMIAVVFIIISAIALYSKVDTTDTLKQQLMTITDFEYGTTKDRIVLWKNTYELCKEKPFWGHGLGSWKIDILKYGNSDLKSSNNVTFYQRPHNEYLSIWAESGVLIILYVAIFIIVLVFLVKNIHKGNMEERILSLLLIGGLVGYLSYSFFSFPGERVEQNMLISFYISLALIISNRLFPSTKKFTVKSSVIAISLLIPTAIVLVFGIGRFKSEKHIKAGYEYRERNNWKRMRSEMKKVNPFFATLDPFSTPIDWYIGMSYYNEGNIKKALHNFSKAKQKNPYHIHILNNEATCYAHFASYDKAINSYKQAIHIAPNFEDALFNIVTCYYQNNMPDSAIAYFRKIKEPLDKKRYSNVIEALIKPKCRDIIANTSNIELKRQLESITHTQDWLSDIFLKSVAENRTFRAQFLMDAIYMLKTNEILNSDEIHSINEKYNL